MAALGGHRGRPGGRLLIVRPGTDVFSPWSLAVLLSVAVITLRDIVTRRLSPAVPSLKVALMTAVGVTLLGGALSLGEPFRPVGAGQAGAIGLAAAFILGGYLFSIMAMRVGEVAFVTPFRYTAILWGLLLGVAVFGESPDALTVLGAVLVAVTGLYTLLREGRARDAAARPMAPGPRR